MAFTKEDKNLEEFLLRSRKISKEKALLFRTKQRKTGKSLFEVVKTEGILPAKTLIRAFGKAIGIEFVDLEGRKIKKSFLLNLPENMAKRYQAVIFGQKDTKLKLAMINPKDLPAIESIQKRISRELEIYIATPESIYQALAQYSGLEVEVEKAVTEELGGFIPAGVIPTEVPTLKEILKEGSPIARLVSTIIEQAIRERSSDIHIEPAEDRVIVRFRIDGVLHQRLELKKVILSAIVSRIKVLSDLKIDETRLPQDGRFKMNILGKEIDFRVSTFPTVNGEKVVLRILGWEGERVLSLEELGLGGKSLERVVVHLIEKPQGLILVCGPTGAGKTTTLYSVIDKINREGVNIITLEDPVEYRIPHVNQAQINPDIEFTFANGLRSILRQDPDVIMVGEIRDFETAEMAIHASLTGHIVLSTLHTTDAAGAIPRLVDMGVEPFLVASALSVVMAQRLVRKICENCKTEYTPSSAVIQEINRELGKIPIETRKLFNLKEQTVFYKGKGCSQCNYFGYRGRIGIFEVIPVEEEIESLIIKRASAADISKAATSSGMINMKQDGIIKVLKGSTTIEEVWRVVEVG